MGRSGKYQYAYDKIDQFIWSIDKQTSTLRAAFIEHLRLVSAAMDEIERVDGGDSSLGDEDKYIRAALGANADKLVAAILVTRAEELTKELGEQIKKLQ